MIEIYLLLPLTVLKLISYSLIPLKAVPTITTLMPVRHRISKLTNQSLPWTRCAQPLNRKLYL